jgi:LacI family transcriptional regulator
MAKDLGVSITKVSRALSDNHQISHIEKKRIIAYAEKVKYQPNPHAKSLRSSKTNNIAVLIPDISNSYFSLALKGIESLFHEKGYNLIIYQTNDDYQTEEKVFRYLQNGLVDGVLSAISMNKNGHAEHVQRLNAQMPIVFFDRTIDCDKIPRIVCNDYKVGFEATNYLLDRGCNNILFVGLDDCISVTANRLNGYLDAFKLKGLMADTSNILLMQEQEKVEDLIRKVLLRNPSIDGIFSTVERYTLILYQVCKKLNIKIPEQLKVISFSNNPFSSLMSPSLSVIIPPAYDIGLEAARVLIYLIKKKNMEIGFSLNKELPCIITYNESSL